MSTYSSCSRHHTLGELRGGLRLRAPGTRRRGSGAGARRQVTARHRGDRRASATLARCGVSNVRNSNSSPLAAANASTSSRERAPGASSMTRPESSSTARPYLVLPLPG
ncbi:hypothetical protein GCM10017559_17060 [Streptosporangium longisporum]|uniref:Uncharacterized protein n=1 Tax=Streptosporangium longisporum TaxID=46187 RepID=A0ABN3XU59_9ACTN